MIKYICDCCGKENADFKLKNVEEPPCGASHSTEYLSFFFREKHYCSKACLIKHEIRVAQKFYGENWVERNNLVERKNSPLPDGWEFLDLEGLRKILKLMENRGDFK